MPSKSIDLNPNGALHRRILDGVRERVQISKRSFDSKHTKWRQAEEVALAYMPERDVDKARKSARDSGSPQYTTIFVPYSYGVLMSSHTYWTTVFMSRNPILQFSGRHGESEQATQALEAVMSYQTDVGRLLVPWYIWLFDVGKYGCGILGTYWDEEFSIVSHIEEREDMFLGVLKTGKMKKVKVSKRVPGYEGNKCYNVRPFDFLPDPRVTLANFQQGEFCAVYRRIGWNTILKRADQGYYINIDELRPTSHLHDQHPTEGSSRLELPSNNSIFTHNMDSARGNGKEADSGVVSAYEVYIELIPSDWGLGNSDLPEKWVFTVTVDFKTVFGCQPLGAHHDKFPFNVLVMEPEGYGIIPRGMPEILEPVQNTINWLINSHFYNVRKILNGQYIVDPSRITISDMLDPSPGGIIRMKPNGYGSNPNEAYAQMQAIDVTQGHMRDIQVMLEIGMRAVGVNDQIMGVLQGGGRKTATEVRSASTFGINRLKTNAEFFSASGWAPMAQMMVQNTQQYYDAEKKFRIVGDLAQSTSAAFMDVSPESITGFYDFVPVDGTLPVDRFAQANLWKEILAQMRQMPEIAAQYDVGKIFSYIAQIAGLKNINQFKVQLGSPQQLAQQAQTGNVVPLGGGGQRANLAEPAQIPNMGATG